MKHLLTAFFLCATLGSFGQETDSIPIFNFAVVEEFPVYAGCDSTQSREAIFTCMQQKLVKHIGENFKYPEKARKKGIEGKVYVNFIIERDGSISSVAVARGAHKLLNEEAVRVVKSIPKFDRPAYQRGEPVRMQYTLPINAKL